jgi:hypothetical protein
MFDHRTQGLVSLAKLWHFEPPNQWRGEDADSVALVANTEWTYHRVAGRIRQLPVDLH